MPAGVHGSGECELALDAEHEPAEVGRVQAVGVLVGVDELEHRVLVDARGQRQLHDVAGDRGVGVEVGDRRAHLGLGCRGRQVDPDRLDADLGAVAVLAARRS